MSMQESRTSSDSDNEPRRHTQTEDCEPGTDRGHGTGKPQGLAKRLMSRFSEATLPTQATVAFASAVCVSLGAAALAGNPTAGSEGSDQLVIGTTVAEAAAQAEERDAGRQGGERAVESGSGEAPETSPVDKASAADARNRGTGETADSRKGEASGGIPASDGGGGHAGDSPAPAEEPPYVPSFSAKHMIADYHAHDDGSLNEWYYGYYIAHSWSPAGQAIANAGIGDSIVVDGTEVRIYDEAVRPDWVSYEDMRAEFGTDCVLFQTCAGDGANNLMRIGHADGWGPFPALSDNVIYEEYYEEYAEPEPDPGIAVCYGTISRSETYEETTTIDTDASSEGGTASVSGSIGG